MYDEIVTNILQNLDKNSQFILLYFLVKEKIRYVGLNNFYTFLNLIFEEVKE